MKFFLILFSVFGLLQFCWANDLGKESIGRMEVHVYYATNGDPGLAGSKAKKVEAEVVEQLSSLRDKKYTSYLLLGSDRQPVFRSYENWLAPLKPSEELLISFEPRGAAQGEMLKLDLELWQSKKKIMKAGPTLQKGKPLYIFGPKWRDGRLILSIQLVELIQ
ncbi:hypothetical protein ACFPK9_00790 [Rubritalea spongiae]|uniref:Uncharacterized protein n=1 Tax=Rubritalea spongiae TaxID=430797 RepID=A0ABW5E5U6_9BACT